MPRATTDNSKTLLGIQEALGARLSKLKFDRPVTHVYNPCEYAAAMMRAYIERYGRGRKRVLLLGMNPGPWGMAQTGVPFGEVSAVRDWLKLSAPIEKPAIEHAKRPVLGLSCARSEVSGARLWGWARERFGGASAFFRTFFVVNYCPLCFLEASGRNRTPDQLPASEVRPLYEACDDALRAIVANLRPEYAVGVGVFAEKRLRLALGDGGPRIGRILHPSPASPAANRGWADAATSELRAMGIAIPGK